MKISARNSFPGKITEVKLGPISNARDDRRRPPSVVPAAPRGR
jgi:hypothetical protein